MNAVQLLGEVIIQFPDLTDLPWNLEGSRAAANLEDLGGIYLEPSTKQPGTQTLVVVPAPEILPVVNKLWAAGWKRGSRYATGGMGWWLYAYLRRHGAEVRVEGMISDAGFGNAAIPFFAPKPPALRSGPAFVAEYREWERKCHEEEW